MRELVADLIGRHPDEKPFLAHDHVVTHGALREAVAAEASLFAASGVGKGTTVLVGVPPSFSQLEVVLALWSLGAQVISIDHRLKPAEVAVLRGLCRPQFIVRAGATGRSTRTFRERYELVTERRSDGLPARTAHRLVQFSSGSTGLPKVIGRSVESITAELARFASSDGMAKPGDRWLLLNSTPHSFGLVGGLLHSLAVGAQVVFTPRVTGADILHTALVHEVDLITGLPFHIAALNEVTTPPALPKLRTVFTGGELMTPEVADRFADTYGLAVGECFGTTETGALTMDETGASRPSVGRPMDGVRLRVRDGLVEVALDESPYLRVDGEPRYVDGWLRTGDRGELDATGNLTLLGRSDSLVVVQGSNVDLAEVEATLRGHPHVTEAIVVHGDVIEAYVGAGSAALSADDLSAWCRDRLAVFKRPQRIRVLPVLPRTSSGKLVRNPAVLAVA